MFRIGRDNTIINYNSRDHDKDSIICLSYGEVDCRCHVHKQVGLGKDEDDVIQELVANYFTTINNHIDKDKYKQIIVVGVIPPTRQSDYETVNPPISHEFPFLGNDDDRVRYTVKVNSMVNTFCSEYGYTYFNPYAYYTREDGTFKYEFSDKSVHLRDNSFFLEQFMDLISK